MTKDLPSPELLRKLLRYEPDTGKLFWRERTPDMFCNGRHSTAHTCAKWNANYAFKEAGGKMTNGYSSVSVQSKRLLAHRIAFAIYYNKWPDGIIDHKNGIVSDNRIENIHDVNSVQNNMNQKRHCDNKSGVTGVWYDKSRGTYQAYISINNKRVWAKRFGDLEEATNQRMVMQEKLKFSERHGQ